MQSGDNETNYGAVVNTFVFIYDSGRNRWGEQCNDSIQWESGNDDDQHSRTYGTHYFIVCVTPLSLLKGF